MDNGELWIGWIPNERLCDTDSLTANCINQMFTHGNLITDKHNRCYLENKIPFGPSSLDWIAIAREILWTMHSFHGFHLNNKSWYAYLSFMSGEPKKNVHLGGH